MRFALGLAVLLAATACGASLADPPNELAQLPDGGDRGGGGGADGGGIANNGIDASNDNSSAPDAPITSTLSVADFVAGELSSYCVEAFACASSFPATASTGTFADNFGTSAAECTTGYEDNLGASHVPGDVTNGKIAYDPTSAQACLDGITYPSCAEFWSDGGTYPAACDTAIAGSVADGGTCNSAYECSDADAVCPDRVCTVSQ